MKLKNLLLVVPLSILTKSLLAHPLLDSVGVENQNGKKVILHKLEPKDNYYSIGRRYSVAPGVIIQFNNNASLRVGQVIKVPTEQAFITVAPVQQPAYSQRNQPAQNNSLNTQQASSTDPNVTQYKVSAGETLYAIARRFNTRVEDIVSQNNLRSNSLTPGQMLLIKSAPNSAAAAPVQQSQVAVQPPVSQAQSAIPPAPRDSTTVSPDSTNTERRLPANRYGLSEKNEKGVATWMDDTGLDASKKLVLHRTAPVGTVIKITNPMTNRTTFAKVVGRFTDNESTKDVIIVMSKNTADAIGALDKRFHVNISYGIPNE
ncbi:LysM peptidoglycan-binding domain-containing protein [Mucilaginibacter lacusdianchii]|uniref:LysM peptidoglycan-binding domain-containing protein n=1 Tax=Mucilaginibacter lacusdianchii TaxID=2684211 RepID=UPI00131C944D|nr:LysM peptidoglycan-binding domain-containing protein [Mucilaginibacter sp. JXJ CY 39]